MIIALGRVVSANTDVRARSSDLLDELLPRRNSSATPKTLVGRGTGNLAPLRVTLGCFHALSRLCVAPQRVNPHLPPTNENPLRVYKH